MGARVEVLAVAALAAVNRDGAIPRPRGRRWGGRRGLRARLDVRILPPRARQQGEEDGGGIGEVAASEEARAMVAGREAPRRGTRR